MGGVTDSGRIVVVADAIVRCAVIVVVALLSLEWWGEPEPGSDGVPVGVFVPILGLYAAWNVWVVVRHVRRLTAAGGLDPVVPAEVGWYGLGRLVWLVPWQHDWGWYRGDVRWSLIVATLAVFGLVLARRTSAAEALPD